MLNGRILHTLLWLGIAITNNPVHAHDSPTLTIQGTPSQNIIVNQLTAGVSSEQRHGPVRSGETLSSIAKQHAPTNMSRSRYMDMIFQLNPQAFINQNINKLKVKSLLILPSYQDNNKIADTSIAKQRTQFNNQKIQLTEYNSTLQIKSSSGPTPFIPQVPIRVIVPNTLSQQQKQAKLQAQMQQTQQSGMHQQRLLLQQISELKQQLSASQKTVTGLNQQHQQLSLKNHNLLLQIQDLHVKYEHIISNYIFTPKF
ncbi:MAG: FimV/HubP family polar landmark protein [Moritella sp.]|uniref:type IV pilus assembly protein FimV n=1 Tax=Moritella sp. TaxID=78556 RepID=UPI0029AB0056|nr:FimV/HubP family polar landmark protein [Moritella sp.]MDX2319927.1 FimV/HubP family polar landmark protein [Moritella sp.]